jgi:metal-responsive CopG/Arc/MetJ family transcriptional regulator
MRKRNEKISISISPEVLKVVEQEAARENRSRSNYIETILRGRIKNVEPRRYTVDERP